MNRPRAAIAVAASIASFAAIACNDPEQGPDCRAFVACVKELDVLRGTTTNVARFEPDGACWDGKKGAEVCESACRRGVPVLRAEEPRLTCATANGAR